MKLLLALLLFAISTPVFASGKLTFTPKYTIGQNKITPMFGLSVYERVYGPVFSNIWLGIGSDSFSDHQETWYTLKNTFEVKALQVITFGLGGEIGYRDLDALNKKSDKTWRGQIHGKVAVQIW